MSTAGRSEETPHIYSKEVIQQAERMANMPFSEFLGIALDEVEKIYAGKIPNAGLHMSHWMFLDCESVAIDDDDQAVCMVCMAGSMMRQLCTLDPQDGYDRREGITQFELCQELVAAGAAVSLMQKLERRFCALNQIRKCILPSQGYLDLSHNPQITTSDGEELDGWCATQEWLEERMPAADMNLEAAENPTTLIAHMRKHLIPGLKELGV